MIEQPSSGGPVDRENGCGRADGADAQRWLRRTMWGRVGCGAVWLRGPPRSSRAAGLAIGTELPSARRRCGAGCASAGATSVHCREPVWAPWPVWHTGGFRGRLAAGFSTGCSAPVRTRAVIPLRGVAARGHGCGLRRRGCRRLLGQARRRRGGPDQAVATCSSVFSSLRRSPASARTAGMQAATSAAATATPQPTSRPVRKPLSEVKV